MNTLHGFCGCGCGARTKLAPKTRRERGWVKGNSLSYIHGHHARLEGNPHWKGGWYISHGYVRVLAPEHPRAVCGYVLEHILVVERAMGRPLPLGAEVHHVNRVKDDNRPENLVVCPDNAYHSLLHQRQSALDACGHANWLKCEVCGQHDDPSRLYVRPCGSRGFHRVCGALARRGIRVRRSPDGSLSPEASVIVPDAETLEDGGDDGGDVDHRFALVEGVDTAHQLYGCEEVAL